MKQYELINLKAFEDSRGSLVALEENSNCPFDVKRCFYIFNTNDSDIVRGAHANKYSKFLFIVVSGSCRIKIDTGKENAEFVLNNPKQALYLDKMVWKEMFDFLPNTVLLVLSNEKYNKDEYINDYDEFKKEVSN